jgi:8-oxo-dGTP diphosphatase
MSDIPLTEVTCALIIQKDRMLVAQRSEQMPHPLKWEFPGGKLRKGETPEKCIRREIREELGLEITVVDSLPSMKHHYPNHTIRLLPFVCRIKKGKLTLREHKAHRWVSFADLDKIDWLEADVGVVHEWTRTVSYRMQTFSRAAARSSQPHPSGN